MMLESGYDYERAYRQRHADVEHLSGLGEHMGIVDTDEDRDHTKEMWLRGNHPLAGPLAVHGSARNWLLRIDDHNNLEIVNTPSAPQ